MSKSITLQAVVKQLTANQRAVAANIINQLGDGSHPYADEKTLPHFSVEYVRDLLVTAINSGKLSPKGRNKALEVFNKLVPHCPPVAQREPEQCMCMLKDDEHNVIFHVLWASRNAIIVSMDHSVELPTNAEPITEYDEDGTRLVRVPIVRVKAFYTEEQAADIAACIDADERLLSYAR